jgi:AhpC/TSA family
MLPHEKEMVERLKSRPFALIGINSDGGRSALGKILQENGITWRNAVDGSTHGPIAKQWNVRGWPTIYILDAKGVIRYRGLRGQEMEQAVVRLLDELKAQAAQP